MKDGNAPKMKDGRFRGESGILGLLVLFLVGCRSEQGRLGDSLEAARRNVLQVRPAARLDDVRARVWTGAADVGTDEDSDPLYLSIPEVLRVLDAQAPVLTALRIANRSDLDLVSKDLLDPASPFLQGLALPSRGLVLVRPAAVGSLEVVAHELGHVATACMAYMKKERMYLRPGVPLDAAWVDLDALIAAWMLGEGDAQITARAAHAVEKGGVAAADAVWSSVPAFSPESLTEMKLTGPATLHFEDGTTIALLKGETFHVPVDLPQALAHLAYEGSLATVASFHEQGDRVEDTLHRMWSSASYTTRELLFPGKGSKSSHLADRVRRNAPRLKALGVTGATRVGTVFLHQMLVRIAHLDDPEAQRIAWGLEDDIVVRAGDGGMIWRTEWLDPGRATEFAGLYATVLKRTKTDAKIEQVGRRVTVLYGQVPGAQELLDLLPSASS